MPPAVTNAFKNWLKANTGMKLTSDVAVNHIIAEGITNFDTLTDFDKKAIQFLPNICRREVEAIVADTANGIQAENAVPGTNIGSISIQRLIVAMHAANYYSSIGRTMTAQNMHFTNVLSSFKLEWDDYTSLKSLDDPAVPAINDKDNDRKIIKWTPIFLDCMSRTFGSRGPLAYVLRENNAVPTEADDPLHANSYFGASGSLLDELIARLPHTGAIYKSDNATVYMAIEKAARGTSVESTVKTFSRRKDGRGAFQALLSNHAGETKYRSIMKKRMQLLQNTKWNGRSFPLESHVSNHRAAIDDLNECANHITVSVPDQSQRVEYLIDSIACNDNTLQAAIGLVRANTNNMRHDFEAAASALIEVDPFKRGNKSGGTQRTANISAIDFSAGRGSTGVDLRWQPNKEFKKLPEEQKNELREWMQTQEGKKLMKQSRKAAAAKRKASSDNDKNGEGSKGNGGGNWKKKFKRAMQTPQGVKSVMSLLAEEEQKNQSFVAALSASSNASQNVPPQGQATNNTSTQQSGSNVSAVAAAFPATSVKLQNILKNGKH